MEYTLTMTYELWDLVSRNLIDFFDDRREAIDAVQAYIDADESDEVMLLEYDDAVAGDGRSLSGPDLVRWLQEARTKLPRTA
jgi:hypothetical protein